MINAAGSSQPHNISNSAADSAIRYNAGYVWMISSVAALGGLLFGHDWVVIGGAKPFYESYFRLTSETTIGWANSCALIGCLVGSILSGALSERFGRKKLLILAAMLFALSSVLTGWAFTFTAFVAWRIAGGIAIGIASNVSPTYIAEVGPAPWRGRLVTLNQLTIVVGILAAQIVNWLIAEPVADGATQEMIRQSWNGQYGWRWMFTAVAVPSIAFLVGAIFIPESPRWLARRGDQTQVRRTLARIGGEHYSEIALQEIRQTFAGETQANDQSRSQSASDLRALLTPSVRKILGIGIVLAVLQQWSGINVIFNYAEDIYRGAGYGISGILFNIVITGTINLVFTLLALGLVDRVGRRALMLFGAAGIGISHLLLGFTYRAGIKGWPILLLTLCTIGFYALSLAPVTWVLISELFPNRIRSLGVSVAVSALWIASFILTFSFPLLQRAVGSAGTFWTYAGICFAGFLFILAAVPETKGKSLEQIERELA
ncbi:MAG TPA: sugar porter family MFS transporter [Candidatus Sulfotelmatobacter sp.]|nr:sugar porter family MFS transporter [Candidatus Sulfotelmatobacter sp.]